MTDKSRGLDVNQAREGERLSKTYQSIASCFQSELSSLSNLRGVDLEVGADRAGQIH